MLNLFKRTQPQQTHRDSPTVADLPLLSPDDAQATLAALREMAKQQMVEVHAPDDTHREWRVWLKITCQWITLTEMQQETLAARGQEVR